MTTPKIAIIDLGTNTFHLMIARKEAGKYSVLKRERIAVKIGMGGINEGMILQEGAHRAIAAMQHFKTVIDNEAAQTVFAFGTSAMRNAKNGEEVADQLTAASGIPIKIISGDQEAIYIYEGVRSAVSMNSHPALIVDIGGGSVECILANDQQIFWKQSFEIGAQRLLERFQKHDPILPGEIDSLDNFFAATLAPLLVELGKYNPQEMIGSSGTFDTLSEMYSLAHEIPYSETFPETPLTIGSFYETYAALKLKNRAARMQMPGMIEMRADMITVACCLIDFLLKSHPFNKIRVSTFSLKEGVLATL